MTATPLSVYRILPPFKEGLRSILVDDWPLIRWQTHGDPAEMPTRVTAEWQGPPNFREIDYPSSSLGAPVLSRRVADKVRDRFSPGGSFLPVSVSGEPEGKYELYVAEHVVDCLDPDRSSAPLQPTLVIEKAVFLPERLPLEYAAFRVPGFPRGVYWNGWAVELLCELIGRDDLELRLVWSTDPDAVPHRNPMGF
ncbi:hypothetical protein [Streptomyces marispadix]|uniref:Uncharacterized protein n=1 Tax=Streptomyces marispadix TaxID=2922868 RepID=A0ABS9SW36_9ACTN|nr:hypothetical protein [Streptomyces marispadix]MCH6160408.1 hypothetical protein [Streptomyces marispadix]